ncbi:MAG: hypothetical protein HKUEN01_05510 [Candidatus Kuenenia stuttgartiensis]|nr:MAG: hypothetical protein HKUEN01_05510 [Candidatus Kuenenia stuttgartiensis]
MNNLIEAKCPVCGNSSKFKIIGKPKIISPKAKLLFKDEMYQVLMCKNCRFYFVSPQNLTNVEMSKLYDETYFTEMTKWWAKKRDKDRKNRLDKLQRFINQKRIRFLDIGCGEGYVLIEAADRGWEVHGIDVFDNRMQSAKRQDIKFYKGDIYNVQFPDNHFDCIYMDSVLEHLFYPVNYLKELNRILKVGGLIYCGVPNEDCLVNDFKKLFYTLSGKGDISARIKPFMQPYHVSGFTKKSLQIAAMKSDFQIVHIKNFAGQYEFLKLRTFTKGFFWEFFLLPIYLIAIPLRKQFYLETILMKKG